MTTITVTLKGGYEFLKDALVCACRYYSASRVGSDTAVLTYICETANRDEAIADVQDCIDIDRLEMMGVELMAIA